MRLANSHAGMPPWIDDPAGHWVTVEECAKVWNKHPNTIRNWCNNGFFPELGHPVYRDPSGIWYIRLTQASHSSQHETT
jgi:hypothetical protein